MLVGPQSGSGRCGEEENRFLMPEIERRFLGGPAHCLVLVLTELTRLHTMRSYPHYSGYLERREVSVLFSVVLFFNIPRVYCLFIVCVAVVWCGLCSSPHSHICVVQESGCQAIYGNASVRGPCLSVRYKETVMPCVTVADEEYFMNSFSSTRFQCA
jgi:hypothetical protein